MNTRRATRALPWLCVSLIVLVVIQPLVGLPPRGADTLLHYYRIPLINSLLEHGVVYSRWAPDLIFGYGYPLFNFYPPLSAYLLTATYWLSGQNALLGLNVAYALILAATCVGMFLLGRRLFGDIGGVFATALYALSPYILFQVYERGSLSNALALASVPYAVLGVIAVAEKPDARRVAWASLAAALVCFAHVSTAVLMSAPIVAAGMIFALGRQGDRRSIMKRVGAIGLVGILGLALSAWVWLPALGEIQFTRYSSAAGNVDVTLFFSDLFRWPAPALDGLANPDLPLSIGLIELIFGLGGLVFASTHLLARWRQPDPRSHSVELLVVFSGVTALVGLFFSMSLSLWWWQHWSALLNFQFPQRWLDLAVFWLALPAGWLVSRLISRGKWLIAISTLALVITFVNALAYLYPLRWQTELPARPTLADATRQAQQQYGIYGLTSWGEYAPATVPDWPNEPPFPGADSGATLDQKLKRDTLPPRSVIAATGGPTQASLRLSLTEPQMLTFYTFYFPGWAATIDGVSTALGPDAAGRLMVDVPAGEHALTIYFGETPLRLFADVLSGAVLVLWLILLVPRRAAGQEPASSDRPTHPAAEARVLATWAGILLLLLSLKVVWFDRVDSAVVHHLQAGTVPGTTLPARRNFGGEIRLLGYQLTAPDQLELFWQAAKIPARDYRIEVNLVDARGAPAGKVVHDQPGHSLTSRWEDGQLVRDEYVLPLDRSQVPIGYYLSVAVVDPVTRQPLSLIDSSDGAQAVSLGATKLPPVVDSAESPGVVFGGTLQLERASVPDVIVAGDTLPLTLTWKSAAATSLDYTVFVHLLNADGTLAAAGDAQPRAGLYPTSFWSPGETIVDERSWLLSLPPGEYRLEVGWYQLETGARLKLASGEDRVLLKTIRVTEAEHK